MKNQELITFRQEKKRTQQEMAEALSITLSMYSKIEAGLKNPSIKTLKRFAKVFPKANIKKIFLEENIT